MREADGAIWQRMISDEEAKIESWQMDHNSASRIHLRGEEMKERSGVERTTSARPGQHRLRKPQLGRARSAQWE